MKKLLSIILTITLLASMVGCGNNSASSGSAAAPSSSVPSEASSTASDSGSSDPALAPNMEKIDLTDLDALYKTYAEVALSSGICATNWTDPAQIDPTDMVASYHWMRLGEKTEVLGEPGYPAAEVEAYCKDRYGIEPEALRTSTDYNSKTNAYYGGGVGSPPYSMVTGARQNNECLYLDYQCLSRADERTTGWGGILSIRFVGDTWKYNYHTSWAPTNEQKGQPAKDILKDYDALNKQYVAPLVSANIIQQSWANAGEIRASGLVDFFAAHHPEAFDGEPYKMQGGSPLVDAAQLESFVRFYFDLPSELVRKSENYQPESHAYLLSGLGSIASTKVTAATLVEDTLTLTVELYGDGTLVATDTLTIREKPEGGYEYLSLKVAKH